MAKASDTWPDYVKNFLKPDGTAIKKIAGNFYLYEIEYERDPVTRRSRKITRSYLGAIKEDGFHPAESRRKKLSLTSATNIGPDIENDSGNKDGDTDTRQCVGNTEEQDQPCEPTILPITAQGKLTLEELKQSGQYMPTLEDVISNPVVQIGAVEYLYNKTERMRENLKACFPEFWAVIYTLAMLRAIHGNGGRLCRMERYYKGSALAYKYPALQLQKEKLGPFLSVLGMSWSKIKHFMQLSVMGDEKILLIDGHRIITLSRNLPTAKKGYDTRRRYLPQLNVMYIYAIDSEGNGYPAFYKKFAGNIPDVSAMTATLPGCNVFPEDITVIGDKGTGSDPVFSYVEDSGRKYIFAIKRGCSEFNGKIPDCGDFDGMFLYKQRAIAHFTTISADGKSKYILFRDFQLFANELTTCCKNKVGACEGSIAKLSKDIDKRKREIESEEQNVIRLEAKLNKELKHRDDTRSIYTNREKATSKAAEAVQASEERLKQKLARANKAVGTPKHANLVRIAEKAEGTLEKSKARLAARQSKLDAITSTLESSEKRVIKLSRDLEMTKGTIASQKATIDALIANLKSEEDILFGEPDSQRKLGSYGYTDWKGTLLLKSNRMDLSAEQIFVAYKQRPRIEGYFKTHDNTLQFDSPYLQDESSVEGWLFLNHLSSTMAVLAMEDIAKAGLTSDISFMGLMGMLGSLRAERVDSAWEMEPYDSKLDDLCSKLNIHPGEMEI